MPSHSSFIDNGSTHGLGQMMVSSEAKHIYDRRQATQPIRLPVQGSGSSTITPVVQPQTRQPIVTTSVPTTGGSYPILTAGSGGGAQTQVNTPSGSSFFTIDGDHLVIAGNHRITKKNAIMVGAGLAGAVILLKTIL